MHTRAVTASCVAIKDDHQIQRKAIKHLIDILGTSNWPPVNGVFYTSGFKKTGGQLTLSSANLHFDIFTVLKIKH